jgi:2-C-methyl-D-erythritol 4-phosphate cytidylyltransferase/2-C-methyl-D-erythritol 2,4-cyclodiphosphate synthase
MQDCTLVVLGAGSSSRFEHKAKKQWLRIEDIPLWLLTTNRLKKYADFKKIIVVGHKDEIHYMRNYSDQFEFVEGGDSRQESMSNALNVVDSKFVMVTDVARCCVPQDVINELFENKDNADCIVPVLSVSDTVVYQDETINRDDVKLIQTPQLSNTDVLKEALKTSTEFTDDSSAIKISGGTVFYTKGSIKSSKLTFGDELNNLDCLDKPSNDCFNGTGYDIHPFEDGKQMVLGGVKIDSPFGFKAHSDGDVLIHSVIDAILGSIGAGDIGEFFPDTDQKYKNADSTKMLENIVKFTTNVGYELINVDITIIAQVPKINPYKDQIKTVMANLLGLPKYKVNIKATTAEKLGFIGRCEGVAVQSSATTKFYNWKENK